MIKVYLLVETIEKDQMKQKEIEENEEEEKKEMIMMMRITVTMILKEFLKTEEIEVIGMIRVWRINGVHIHLQLNDHSTVVMNTQMKTRMKVLTLKCA